VKPTAIGRILIWRGSSLWVGHAGEPTDVHAHHAVQIALPFREGRVSFARPCAGWTQYPAAIVAANEPHAFEARAQFMAQIFVEPESVPGIALQRRYRAEGIAPLPIADIRPQVESLANAYERRASDAELFALTQSIVTSLAGATSSPASTDPRIAAAIAELKERLEESIPLASVASAVGLSSDRFRHLFVAETGVAFRRYILWLRLERALAAYVNGESLTEAAQSGGFADSAHFSRTFRRMFGIAPVSVRPE
jgi:AraC family transcriptional regulator